MDQWNLFLPRSLSMLVTQKMSSTDWHLVHSHKTINSKLLIMRLRCSQNVFLQHTLRPCLMSFDQQPLSSHIAKSSNWSQYTSFDWLFFVWTKTANEKHQRFSGFTIGSLDEFNWSLISITDGLREKNEPWSFWNYVELQTLL